MGCSCLFSLFALASIFYVLSIGFLHQSLSSNHSEDAADWLIMYPAQQSGGKGKSRTMKERLQVNGGAAKESWLDAISFVQNPGGMNTSFAFVPPSSIVSRLQVVEPTTWNDTCMHNLRVAPTYDGIMHATWEAGLGRFHGIEDRPVPSSEGGRTVRGQWPDYVNELVYIPILKNGHSHLMNTVGDLRQRLGGKSELHKHPPTIKRIMENVMKRQRAGARNGIPGVIVFAIVRDPVSRFLSATCQEMTFGLTRKMISKCPDLKHKGGVAEENLVDCAISLLQGGDWAFHQHSQVAQILKVITGLHVGVTLVPQEESFLPLLDELGGQNVIVRDRSKDDVYKKTEHLRRLCSVKPHNLTQDQVNAICKLYEGDVRMMEYAGIQSKFC